MYHDNYVNILIMELEYYFCMYHDNYVNLLYNEACTIDCK